MKSLTLGFALSTLLIASSAFADAWDTQLEMMRAAAPKPPRSPATPTAYVPARLSPLAAKVRTLKLPAGFYIRKYAEIESPRMMAVNTDGTVYVSSRELGSIRMLKDTNGDGVADIQKEVATAPNLHGLAIHDGKLYMAAVNSVFVADIQANGTLGAKKEIVSNLPEAGAHNNRSLGIGPDNKLYLSIGSTCNACEETSNQLATMMRFDLDGSHPVIFASGLRNTIGFGWHPTTSQLFGWDNGVDLLNATSPEELNSITNGKLYGWPYVYGAGLVNPALSPEQKFGLTGAEWAKNSVNPLLTYTAHAAPMQMLFYTGAAFPADYKNDAFIAFHGSWDRPMASGYEVVRVKFNANGKPTQTLPFLSGFYRKKAGPKGQDAQFGRPMGLGQMPDGSLLIGDDTEGVIYRVAYAADARKIPTEPGIMKREDILLNLPETADARLELPVTSPIFAAGGALPDQLSNYHENQSPALSWTMIPSTAKSLAIVVEDPDAIVKPITHWMVANLPISVTSIPQNLPPSDQLDAFGGAIQGGNQLGRVGYYGPRPPPGDAAHRYHFQVYALDAVLPLQPGFSRQAFLDAINGHVIGKGEIIGTYQRP